uniref:Uncharacterized protein n=1 Tax=Siphoviridae sp. ctKwY15 TaxID=2827843 RepID=A0A8S5SV26_9CAUD|nr:MAG TPA: hypothetical protein [Siphoviridae sp. ctKwY15]
MSQGNQSHMECVDCIGSDTDTILIMCFSYFFRWNIQK